jgi:hypothetical protein
MAPLVACLKCALNRAADENSVMRRLGWRLIWGNMDAAGFLALGDQAAFLFGVVAKVRPVDTA